MKLLANIFLSGLAILACVSCSKDEDPVLSLEGAKLSVAVKASGTATKAYNPNDVNELEGEAYINNLAVVVFNETGTELLGYKWEALSGAEHSAIIACRQRRLSGHGSLSWRTCREIYYLPFLPTMSSRLAW